MILAHESGLEKATVATSASELTLLACDAPDLRALAGLKHLRVLRLACSRLGSLAGLEALALDTLEILFTPLDDLGPLLGGKPPRNLRVFGTPLPAGGVSALQGSVACLESASEAEQTLTDRVWQSLGLCFGGPPGDSGLLVRPGPRPDQRVDYVTHWAESLQQEPLDDAARIMALGYRDPAARPDEQRFRCEWSTGNADDLRRWIDDAQLSSDDRDALLRLISRFPRELFFRHTDAAIRLFEQRKQVTVPAAVRRFRTEVLSSIRSPATSIYAYFDRFDRAGSAERPGGGWYEIGLLGSRQEMRPVERDFARLLPLAETPGSDESSLAVRLDHADDTALFEYSPRGLRDAAQSGLEPSVELRLVSLASMWGHVTKIRSISEGAPHD
jgi:hypothetical protein